MTEECLCVPRLIQQGRLRQLFPAGTQLKFASEPGTWLYLESWKANIVGFDDEGLFTQL